MNLTTLVGAHGLGRVPPDVSAADIAARSTGSLTARGSLGVGAYSCRPCDFLEPCGSVSRGGCCGCPPRAGEGAGIPEARCLGLLRNGTPRYFVWWARAGVQGKVFVGPLFSVEHSEALLFCPARRCVMGLGLAYCSTLYQPSRNEETEGDGSCERSTFLRSYQALLAGSARSRCLGQGEF